MIVTVSIEKLLKKHNVSYSLANILLSSVTTKGAKIQSIAQYAHQQTAHAHLLQSPSQQKLLAITPNQTILDLQAIKDALGEPYSPVVGSALQSFVSKA